MPGTVCRAGRMALAGRLACLYRLAHPLPLGAGDYVRPADVVSACGEGVGVSSRFSYLVARRRVILLPSSSSSLPACFAVSPCRSHPRPPASCASFLPLLRLFLSCVLVWFLIASLPVLAISRAGRSLLARFLFVAVLALSYRVPVLACPPLIVLDRSRPVLILCRRSSRSSFRSCLVAFLFVVSPRPSTSVGGERGGLLLLACPRSRRAGGGRCRRDSVDVAGLVAFLALMAGGRCGVVDCGCVGFVVSVFVYINWVLVRV